MRVLAPTTEVPHPTTPPPADPRGSITTVCPLLGIESRLEVSEGGGEVVAAREEVGDGGTATRESDEELDARHPCSDEILTETES